MVGEEAKFSLLTDDMIVCIAIPVDPAGWQCKVSPGYLITFRENGPAVNQQCIIRKYIVFHQFWDAHFSLTIHYLWNWYKSYNQRPLRIAVGLMEVGSSRQDLHLHRSLWALLAWDHLTFSSLSRGFWTTPVVWIYTSDLREYCLMVRIPRGGRFCLFCCQSWDTQVLLLSLSMWHVLIILRL